MPGLLILATLGITVRSILYMWSSNEFVYFVQPIMRTTLTGLLFAGSVAFGRPLIARFAGDFCPLSAEVRARPGVLRLFSRTVARVGDGQRVGGGIQPGAAADGAGAGVRADRGGGGVDRDL